MFQFQDVNFGENYFLIKFLKCKYLLKSKEKVKLSGEKIYRDKFFERIGLSTK